MKATYQNRYGDNILFEKVDDNTVRMSGYNSDWIRYGYDNDYTQAHAAYLADCAALEEPDMRLLVEDKNESKIRPMTIEEFENYYMHKDTDPHALKNPFREYYKLITSNHDSIHMVDPSGGPYIAKGTNLKYYFNDKKNMVVNNIKFDPSGVLLTVK
jgi:hypothetical protein